jgi:hypothetical protein
MGFGITMASLLHDVSQLRRVYGVDEAQTILGAHHVFMALRSIDPHTAAFLDSVIGADPHPSLPSGTGVARLRRIPAGHAIAMVGDADPQLLRLPSLDDPLLRMELERSPSDDPPQQPEAEPPARPAPEPKPRSRRRPVDAGLPRRRPPRRRDEVPPEPLGGRDGDDAPDQEDGRRRRWDEPFPWEVDPPEDPWVE